MIYQKMKIKKVEGMVAKIPFVDLKSQYAVIENDILSAIKKVLDHGQYIMGPEMSECEKALASYCGVKHALTCSSGTDALLMSLMALDIKNGDEVIVPGLSFIATAEAVVLAGATPVFVDIDPMTYNLDPQKLAQAYSKKTKAIIPVSLYGQISDIEEINKFAADSNITVIEDGAQSFGASYKGKKSCGLSTIGCTSFFPAKTLGCYGDGGAIFTNDDNLAEKINEIRDHGSVSRYNHIRIGMNGRLDTIQCAILLVKLKNFDWEIKQRQIIAQRYKDKLKNCSNMTLPHIKKDHQSAFGQYTVRVSNRDQFQSLMIKKGVPTAIHYPLAMHEQKAYTKWAPTTWSLKESEASAKQVISLPISPYLKEQDQGVVIDAVISCLN